MRTRLPELASVVPDNATCVFRGVLYDIYQWPQKLFDGSTTTFEMLKRADTVQIIAIKDGKLVILEELQPNGPLYYCAPAGRHDHEDEDELQAAKRELLEETGFMFKTWKLLSIDQPSGKIEHFIYTFLATDFERQGEQKLDAGEKITVKLMDFDAAKELLASEQGRYLPNEIEHASSIADLLSLPAYD